MRLLQAPEPGQTAPVGTGRVTRLALDALCRWAALCRNTILADGQILSSTLARENDSSVVQLR